MILVFDTETTGLVANHTVRMDKQPEVIEFAGVMINPGSGEIVEEFETLIKPKYPIEERITKITGLTDDSVRLAPSFAKVALTSRKMIEDSVAVFAHNASFDCEMLDLEFERLKQTVEWPLKICTVEQTVHIKGHRMTLGMLHAHLFGLQHVDAHRAMADVKALARCVVEMMRKEMIWI